MYETAKTNSKTRTTQNCIYKAKNTGAMNNRPGVFQLLTSLLIIDLSQIVSKRGVAIDNELNVITKSKDLCGYVLTVTEKSPKRFRFTLVSRMQNLTLELIENLYRANEIYMAGGNRERAYETRLAFQHSALTTSKLLGYMSLLAREQGCILPKQYQQVTKLISDCQNMIGAWINSDRKRYLPK